MQLDKTTLQVNPEILEVLDFAKAQNKTVILVADSYYSSKFITEILHEKGITNYDRVFSSADLREGKDTGKLFEEIL